MLPVNPRSNENLNEPLRKLRPGVAFVVMIFCALIAFEIFNFTTTEHALGDLLGDLTFIGIPWATILSIAFCGIDFAGIARLFTPEQGLDEPKEVWYLFGAWLLAATMNAILTWWGVSMAVISHGVQSSAMIDPKTLTTVVPVFVAVMVWVIRILIIGTLSLSMDRLLYPDQAAQRTMLENAIPMQHPMQEPMSREQRSPEQRASRGVEPTYPYPSSLGNNSYNQRPPASRAASPNRPATTSPRPAHNTPVNDDEDLFGDSRGSNPRARGEPSYHRLGDVSARPSESGGKKLS